MKALGLHKRPFRSSLIASSDHHAEDHQRCSLLAQYIPMAGIGFLGRSSRLGIQSSSVKRIIVYTGRRSLSPVYSTLRRFMGSERSASAEARTITSVVGCKRLLGGRQAETRTRCTHRREPGRPSDTQVKSSACSFFVGRLTDPPNQRTPCPRRVLRSTD